MDAMFYVLYAKMLQPLLWWPSPSDSERQAPSSGPNEKICLFLGVAIVILVVFFFFCKSTIATIVFMVATVLSQKLKKKRKKKRKKIVSFDFCQLIECCLAKYFDITLYHEIDIYVSAHISLLCCVLCCVCYSLIWQRSPSAWNWAQSHTPLSWHQPPLRQPQYSENKVNKLQLFGCQQVWASLRPLKFPS